VKDSRVGELLWKEWTGEGYEPLHDDSVVFFTEDHVDLENEVIRRALASALQRDGVSVSLGKGFQFLETSHVTYGYAGEVDGDMDLTACDEEGETREGDSVDDTLFVTWVEVTVE
jgi:hypothetical protein